MVCLLGWRWFSIAVRHYMGQVLDGLLYLHKHHIMHRDLSLSNLLLNKDMDVVSYCIRVVYKLSAFVPFVSVYQCVKQAVNSYHEHFTLSFTLSFQLLVCQYKALFQRILVGTGCRKLLTLAWQHSFDSLASSTWQCAGHQTLSVQRLPARLLMG